MTRREMTEDEADDRRKTLGRAESDRRMGWPYAPRPEPEVRCVNAHDLCWQGGPCPHCEAAQ